MSQRSMLGYIQSGIGRQDLKQSFHPCHNLIRISDTAFKIRVIYDIIEDYDHFISKEEGIVFRSHPPSI